MLGVSKQRGVDSVYGLLCSDVEYSFLKLETTTMTLLCTTALKV